MLLLIQGFKDRLANVLHIHADKRCKILLQGRNCIFHQRSIRTENSDQGFRRDDDNTPHHSCVSENHKCHHGTGFSYTAWASCTIIVTQDWRSPFVDCINRSFYKLSDTGYDGHNRNVDISACDGKYIVADNRYQTVCQLHDKSGSSQAYNVFCISCTAGKFLFFEEPHFQFCFLCKKEKDKCSRKCLRNDRCNCGTAHAKPEHKNKQRVKQQVRYCPYGN